MSCCRGLDSGWGAFTQWAQGATVHLSRQHRRHMPTECYRTDSLVVGTPMQSPQLPPKLWPPLSHLPHLSHPHHQASKDAGNFSPHQPSLRVVPFLSVALDQVLTSCDLGSLLFPGIQKDSQAAVSYKEQSGDRRDMAGTRYMLRGIQNYSLGSTQTFLDLTLNSRMP